jgi:hypothetical protein
MATDRCPTCKRKHKRSLPQNRQYWMLLDELAERLPVRGEYYSAKTWHRWAKGKWLGYTDYKLPNGKTYNELNSTADLDVTEFSDYLTKVEAWAAEHDIYLADREEVA